MVIIKNALGARLDAFFCIKTIQILHKYAKSTDFLKKFAKLPSNRLSKNF